MEFSNETFFNINFKDPFTRVPNSILDNKNLSYSAIGILTQILRFQNSKEYKIYAKTLVSYRKDGKTKVENALKELIKEGFVVRTKLRNEKGHIKGYRYDVFDIPQINEVEIIKCEKFLPCADLPTTVKTKDSKNRNRINQNRENSNIKEINKKEINKKENIDIYSPSSQKEGKTNDKGIHKRIIDYLNEKADKSFKSTTKKTKSLIDARLAEGFVEEDFYKVIDNKVHTWLEDAKMSVYLRPETLFGNKFEFNLNEQTKMAKNGNEKVERDKEVSKNRFANFEQTFTKYSNKELDEIIKKSQKVKFEK